jgi:LDH2 family malate/lactate/ureidoglycolate dehydrogenase
MTQYTFGFMDKRGCVLAAPLRRFTSDVFARAGMADADAAIVADALVWANLRGMDSHGVLRVPGYVEWIRRGDINTKPRMVVATETPAVVVFDADRAAGPIAMTAAMRHAVRKAREAGAGLVLVRATTHTAALGYYTLIAAREGMAGLAFAASTPLMAYHGARAPGVSTTPISIALPGNDSHPLLLDMSSSLIAMGKLNQARRTGEPLPEGAALDAEGRPTTDAKQAVTPLPLGGPKGSGLALMVECLTSLVLGNPIAAEVLEGTARGERHRQNCLALAIDVARFGDPQAFQREAQRLIGVLKALPRAAGVDEILMPGERGGRTFERRTREGIPLPPSVVAELSKVAAALGVTSLPS